ncbi:MAG: VOC family protein [Limnochordia bacterium]
MQQFRCDHIHLKSADVEATARWYCDVLGAKITYEGSFRGSKVYYLDINGTIFFLFGQLEGEESVVPADINPRFGLDHFGFQVDDLDAAVAELRAKNVPIIEEPTTVRPGLKIAYIEGPDRTRIELSQRD